MVNKCIPIRIQLLCIGATLGIEDLGCDCHIYNRLALLIVAYPVKSLASAWLDYRAYSMCFQNGKEVLTVFSQPGDDKDVHEELQCAVEGWCHYTVTW